MLFYDVFSPHDSSFLQLPIVASGIMVWHLAGEGDSLEYGVTGFQVVLELFKTEFAFDILPRLLLYRKGLRDRACRHLGSLRLSRILPRGCPTRGLRTRGLSQVVHRLLFVSCVFWSIKNHGLLIL